MIEAKYLWVPEFAVINGLVSVSDVTNGQF